MAATPISSPNSTELVAAFELEMAENQRSRQRLVRQGMVGARNEQQTTQSHQSSVEG
jgi:hypothetical protein